MNTGDGDTTIIRKIQRLEQQVQANSEDAHEVRELRTFARVLWRIVKGAAVIVPLIAASLALWGG